MSGKAQYSTVESGTLQTGESAQSSKMVLFSDWSASVLFCGSTCSKATISNQTNAFLRTSSYDVGYAQVFLGRWTVHRVFLGRWTIHRISQLGRVCWLEHSCSNVNLSCKKSYFGSVKAPRQVELHSRIWYCVLCWCKYFARRMET